MTLKPTGLPRRNRAASCRGQLAHDIVVDHRPLGQVFDPFEDAIDEIISRFQAEFFQTVGDSAAAGVAA
jgi:hypothetical protein